MPRLLEYENPEADDQLRPQEGGIRAAEQAGYREGRLYQEGNAALQQGLHAVGQAAGDIYKVHDDAQTQQQIIGGMQKAADLQLQSSDDWNKIRATTDPSQLGAAAHQFEQNLAAQKDQFLSGFTTDRSQAWAAQHWTNFYVKSIQRNRADVASAQGDAAIAGIQGTIDKYGNASIRDPSSLDTNLGLFNHGLDALRSNSPFMPREKWDEIRQKGAQQIVQGGIYGLAKQDPNAAMSMLDSGKYDQYLTPQQGEHLRANIRADTLASRADRRAARADARDAEVDQSRSYERNVISQITVNPDGSYKFPANFRQQVLTDAQQGKLLPESAMSWINKANAQGIRADTAQQKDTFGNLASGILLPPDDPNHTSEAQVLAATGHSGGLDPSQANFLIGKLHDKDPASKDLIRQTITQIKEAMTNGGADTSPSVFAGQTKAVAYMWDKLQSGAARNQSTEQLLDPSSPDYIFKPPKVLAPGQSVFDQFKATAQDAVNPVIQRNLAAVKPISDAVDTAMQVTDLMKYNSPEAVNDILHSRGINLDVRDGRWCAALVNTALSSAGLKGSGSELASSFKNWGFPVDAQHVERNDVFYSSSGTGEGYSGHVGLLTGRTRVAPNGGLEVQVVSSHIQGSSENAGGVEWRPASGLMIRRAKPPLHQIMSTPGIASRVLGGLGAVVAHFHEGTPQ